ncbi:contact-dependent growth inhibition system immunity protein [Curtobacterium sp. MCBA15_004]|uniref:contact-dependent growth inhibition system immunity protein n=1 Tax=unclassified Curtobacterium TaxID=257496 RepID=UPI000A47965E|nr:contact-dependent growth inhibition system immunity protein [Curtobacterium sp. MCBA15_004]WIA97501.1 contact-dependent growth inhibition system immunity protein [Curtobacterium sp. MCBA15_004]
MDLESLTKQYPHFWTLMGAYFNYDWRDEYETAERAYDDAFGWMNRGGLEEIDAELSAIAAEYPTDDAVERLLGAIDTGLDPSLDTGRTPAQWLGDLRRHVRGLLDAPDA